MREPIVPPGIRLQWFNPVLRGAGATLHWGIDYTGDLEKFGLTLALSLTNLVSPPCAGASTDRGSSYPPRTV